MIALGSFLKTYWRGLLVVALIGVIAYYVGSYKERGTLIVTLKSTVGRLDSLITRKNDTLSIIRDQVAGLQGDTARYRGQLKDKSIANLNLKAQLSAGERAALLTDQAIAEGKRQVNNLVDTMSNLEKKQAADAGLADEDLSFVGAGTSVDDVEVNERIAKLTRYGKVYKDSTNALKQVVGQQRERIQQQDGQIIQLTNENSDLENELNGVRNVAADALEDLKANKKPFNINLGKQIQQKANDFRAGRIRLKKP